MGVEEIRGRDEEYTPKQTEEMEDQHTHCSNSGSCISRQLISLSVSVREKPFRQLGHVHVGFWISKRSLFEITRQTRLALCRNLQSPFRFAPIALRLATTPCVPSKFYRAVWRFPAATVRDGRISTSAEMPSVACRRRIMLMDKLRRRFRTSATRVLVPIIGSSCFRVSLFWLIRT